MTRKKSLKFFTGVLLSFLIIGILLVALYIVKPKDKNASAEQESAIIQLQQQIVELNENVNTLLVVVEEKDYQIGYMTLALNEAEEELSEKNIALSTLSNEVVRKNGEIDKLTEENNFYKKEIEDLKKDTEANAQKIAELETKVETNAAVLADLQIELENTKITLSHTQTKIAEIENKISDTNSKIEKLETAISEVNIEIERMQTKIESLNSSIQMLFLGSITEIHISQTDKYETSYVVFGNGLCLQWGFNNCSSKGVINQELAEEYNSMTYLVMLTPATQPTTATVWAARVNTVYTNHFVGYLTNRTSGSNDYSNGGGYYWFTIGQIVV